MKLWSSNNKPGDDAGARSSSPVPQKGPSKGSRIEAILLMVLMFAAASTLEGWWGV